MFYFLAGSFVGSLTTFLAMAFVICADDKKREDADAENQRIKEELEKLIKKYE